MFGFSKLTVQGVALIGAMTISSLTAAQTIALRRLPTLEGAFTSAMVDVPGDDRLIALDYTGKIRIVRRGDQGVLAAPALDFTALVPIQGDENGALGLAIHPNFASNGYIYVFHSQQNNVGPVIARYTVPQGSTGPIDPATRTVIMQFPSFSVIHISGWIAFGPDGLLYITHGDNGASGFAQDTNTVKGKILRIDVDRDDFPADPLRNYGIPAKNPLATSGGLSAPEIWCVGVRNSWRCSFDRMTGEFYSGDVGDATREELNRLPASAWQNPGGFNFGWPCYEGNLVRTTTGCTYTTFPYMPPLDDFTRAEMTCIVGGFVYRGCVSELQGRYFFANCLTFNKLLSLDPVNPEGPIVQHTLSPSGIGQIMSFAQDSQGNVYVLSGSGPLQIAGTGTANADCNQNLVPDSCDFALGNATDFNDNGVPDSCEALCEGDFNADQVISVQDIFDYLGVWFSSIPAGDFNHVGGVTVQDVFDFLAAWFAGCD